MEKDLVEINLTRHEVIRSKKYQGEDYGPFSMIGVLRNMQNKTTEPMDVLDILVRLPKGALILFNELKLVRDPVTNMCHYPTTHLTESEQQVIRRALGELYKAGLVVKARTVDLMEPIKKQTYMIDPSVIKCWKLRRAKEVWNFLKGSKVDSSGEE